MRTLLSAALFASAAFAAGGPVREVQSECPALAGQEICRFRNGYIFQLDHRFKGVIGVYAPDGRFKLNLPVRLPGADVAWANDVAVDPDGGFVVGAVGGDGDVRHVTQRGVVMLDSNGIQTGVIDTKNFSPNHVAIAEDHSIWVLGAQYGPGNKPDYMTLRKYTRDGELAGSYLPRSSFPAGLEPGGEGAPVTVMAAGNRIAVVAFSGNVGNLLELIELDGDGNVLGRMRADHLSGPMTFALTTDGHLYGRSHGGDSRSTLALFDVAAGTSKNVDAPEKVGWLMGADQEALVYRIRSEEGTTKAGWFTQPAADSTVASSGSETGSVSRR
jgi:hypothetical protein